MTHPDFYSPEAVGTLYAPDVTAAAAAGRALNLSPASADKTRTAVLLIDMQVDFIHEDGALSVPGAIADTRRTIEWIYANVGQITTIFASLDSHLPMQIFSPSWWVNAEGQAPQPYTVITAQCRYSPHHGGSTRRDKRHNPTRSSLLNRSLMACGSHCTKQTGRGNTSSNWRNRARSSL